MYRRRVRIKNPDTSHNPLKLGSFGSMMRWRSVHERPFGAICSQRSYLALKQLNRRFFFRLWASWRTFLTGGNIRVEMKMDVERETWRLDRARRAWELRQGGMSFSRIGRIIGRADDSSRPISRVSARQLVLQWQSRLERPDNFLVVMTKRSFNILRNESLRSGEPMTKEFARSLIENGGLTLTPNCGKMTFNEIKAWAYS